MRLSSSTEYVLSPPNLSLSRLLKIASPQDFFTDRRCVSEHLNNGFKAGAMFTCRLYLSRCGNSFSRAWCFCAQCRSLPKLLSHDHDQPYTAQHCHRAKSPMGGETCTVCLSPSLTQMQTNLYTYTWWGAPIHNVFLKLKSLWILQTQAMGSQPAAIA